MSAARCGFLVIEPCRESGCTGRRVARGLCGRHYQVARKGGRLPPLASAAERAIALLSPEPNTGCWLWAGQVNRRGYGNIADGKLVHRVVWAHFHGPIPAGLFLCHRCDTPACSNPDHLFLGTHAENMADMRLKGRSRAGARNTMAKLSEGQVHEIRLELAAGASQPVLAEKYAVHRSTISSIATGARWGKVA